MNLFLFNNNIYFNYKYIVYENKFILFLINYLIISEIYISDNKLCKMWYWILISAVCMA